MSLYCYLSLWLCCCADVNRVYFEVNNLSRGLQEYCVNKVAKRSGIAQFEGFAQLNLIAFVSSRSGL